MWHQPYLRRTISVTFIRHNTCTPNTLGNSETYVPVCRIRAMQITSNAIIRTYCILKKHKYKPTITCSSSRLSCNSIYNYKPKNDKNGALKSWEMGKLSQIVIIKWRSKYTQKLVPSPYFMRGYLDTTQTLQNTARNRQNVSILQGRPWPRAAGATAQGPRTMRAQKY